MIIIADSGSTKTAWRILQNETKIEQATGLGLNPYYLSSERILEEIDTGFLKDYKNAEFQLFFYGSGCASQEKKKLMKDLFQSVLKNAQIEIYDDMLGAARATCNKEEGITCILGTGSNSCFYDGENVVKNIPSSGFILGDEGSGSFMGKVLMGDFIRGSMPEKISDKLLKRFELNRDMILDNVYHQPQANKFLAQFGKFIFQNLKDPYCSKLVVDTFDQFFVKYVMNYERYNEVNVHFVGSIAFYFSDLLRKTAKKHGIRVKNILENPIAGLTLYHQKD